MASPTRCGQRCIAEDMLLVAQAANASEAMVEYRRHHPDITLMDLRLPARMGQRL
jgi:YesN/AraC family two-component response regulator